METLNNITEIEIIPKDQIREPVNQKIEGSKEIENKRDNSVLLSEKKHSRNKENNKYVETKTKKIGKRRPKKQKNTQEELDMIRSGLVNVRNLPIANYIERTELANCRKNLRKVIFKMNTSEKERDNKISDISSIIDIPVTYLVNKIENKVVKAGEDTIENLVFEKVQYRVIKRYVFRTELIGNPIVGLEMSEDFAAEKSEYKLVVIKWTRIEFILKTIIVRTTRTTYVLDNG